MKEWPILFSGPTVRTILDGRKTQSRRVCRDQAATEYKFVTDMKTIPTGPLYTGWAKDCGQSFVLPTKCPQGEPGNRLWVRETFTEIGTNVHYRADNRVFAAGQGPRRWKPSIHMPRKYCRLLLDVTAVRVERLQDINEDDALAEGCNGFDEDGIKFGPLTGFRCLWNTINNKRGFGWDVNPWVWVIEFQTVEDSSG